MKQILIAITIIFSLNVYAENVGTYGKATDLTIHESTGVYVFRMDRNIGIQPSENTGFVSCPGATVIWIRAEYKETQQLAKESADNNQWFKAIGKCGCNGNCIDTVRISKHY